MARAEVECPACGEKKQLFRDRLARGHVVMMCHTCLHAVNFLVTASETTLANWLSYSKWRQGVLLL
jgi:hypothetical protein